MLEATGDTFSDFAGHVKMAQALSKVAFKRAMDASLNPWTQPDATEAPSADAEEAANERLALAIRANESATKLMAQRLEMQDKYKLVERAPMPMAIRLNVVHVDKEEQERRLALARPNRAKNKQAVVETETA